MTDGHYATLLFPDGTRTTIKWWKTLVVDGPNLMLIGEAAAIVVATYQSYEEATAVLEAIGKDLATLRNGGRRGLVVVPPSSRPKALNDAREDVSDQDGPQPCAYCWGFDGLQPCPYCWGFDPRGGWDAENIDR